MKRETMNKSQVTSHELQKWYVIQTKPMAEEKVCQQFVRSSGREVVRSHEIETFYPKIKSITARCKGEEKIKYKPLFPSYIFLRWDLNDPANHHLVKYTRGVNKVLGDGEMAVPISDEIIEVIKSRVSEGGIIEQKTFKVGDQIKVKRGYLRDLIGILERPVSDSGRAAVLLQLFNRQMRVHLSCANIARA